MNALNIQALFRWLAFAALGVALMVYALTDFSTGGASPLGLLVVAVGGWLLQYKEALSGNGLLLLCGGALVTFPFLFEAPLVYSMLGVPIAVAGLLGMVAWWKA